MSKNRQFVIPALLLCLAVVAAAGSGCSKKVAPPPAAPRETPAPAPEPARPAATLRLSASPSTIERGQSATLSWSSSNAASVSIDGGIGTVEPTGSRTISPQASTTYRATASSPGGGASAEARVTVTEPTEIAPPASRPLSDSEFFSTYIKDIYFDYDKYDIQDAARTALLGNARALAERPGLRLTIEGHCDERGSEKYNLALGDRRANAARQFLTTQGVGADRVDTVSYGKERPNCTEQNEECWQKNRRAHFLPR